MPTRTAHAELLSAMALELEMRDPDGSRSAGIGDYASVAREVVAHVVDAAALWTDELGVFYDTTTVRRLLGGPDAPISRQAVFQRRGLLALTTGSGKVVFPAFQFQDAAPAPGLDQVLAALPEALISRWTLASWLVSEEYALDNDRPIDVLKDGDVAAVMAIVRAWAGALAA
jgi:hypothetical protein